MLHRYHILFALGLGLLAACSKPVAAAAKNDAPPHCLAVRTPQGFLGMQGSVDGEHASLIPLTSRSERTVLASVWKGAVEFAVVGGTSPLELGAVAHPLASEVFQDDRGLWAVHPAEAWPAEFTDTPQAWFRRDGVGEARQSTIQLPPVEEGFAWVLVPMETPWGEAERLALKTNRGAIGRAPGRQGAWLLEPQEAMQIELGGQPLDALLLCRVDPISNEQMTPVPVRKSDAPASGMPTGWDWHQPMGEGEALPLLHTDETTEVAAWTASIALYSAERPFAQDPTQAWTLVARLTNGLAAGPRTTKPVEANSNRAPWFKDVAKESGLALMHFEGPDMQLDIRPTMGPGAAFGDYDGDGLQDLYIMQGGGREGWQAQGNKLYRNVGDGQFKDVTEAAGVGDTGAGMGCLFFDADGDGDLDLYAANYGVDVLYQNNGDGTFADVSKEAGLSLDLWSAAVVAGDYDGDGDLDLYVTSYLEYDPSKMPPADELERFQREDPTEMLPFAFPGQRNVLLRNESTDGKLVFTDQTENLGLLNETGLSMQALWWDFDQDNDPDLYVANDVSHNVMFLNKGDGTFEDVTFALGLDDPRGGMGLDVGDMDRDGDEDMMLSNWQLESNALYINRAGGNSASRVRQASFRDNTVASGLGPAGIGVTSWGVAWFDAELDGDLDLFIANGYTSPDYVSTGICVGQPNHFFLNEGRGRFQEASSIAGPDLAVERASRCVVPCDYDQDGDLDILVTSNNGWVQLLRNDSPRGKNHFLGLRLKDLAGNPGGIGARVTITAGDQTLTRSMSAGMGYLGGNAPELLFGLGTHTGPVKAQVTWRNGQTTEVEIPSADGYFSIDSSGKLKSL
ncbi:MAG: CRTAC1 family protein [Planctomycetota bacterium]|nr:CRTAC1 family protein [Planctomycetota bacterium]